MNGFKVKARLIADKLGLAGIAWNLPDGRRVRIIVEGRKGVIKEFIAKLHIHETGILYIDVKSVRTKWVRSTGLYNPGLNIIRNPDTLEYLMTMRRRLLSGYTPDLTVLDS